MLEIGTISPESFMRETGIMNKIQTISSKQLIKLGSDRVDLEYEELGENEFRRESPFLPYSLPTSEMNSYIDAFVMYMVYFLTDRINNCIYQKIKCLTM